MLQPGNKLVVSKPHQLQELYFRLAHKPPNQFPSSPCELEFTELDVRTTIARLPPLLWHENLRSLTFSECKLGAKEVAHILKFYHALEILNLSSNRIGNDAAEELAKYLKSNRNLRELYLQFNQISDDGVLSLLSSMKSNNLSTLTLLNLESNRVKMENVQFVDLLCTCKLTALALNSNQLGEHGMQILSLALRTNVRLKWLFLSGMEMGNTGLQMLTEALQYNHSLEQLSISESGIDDAGAHVIAALLNVNVTLLGIDLALNPIGLLGAQALCAAIGTMVCKVKEVEVDDSVGARMIRAAINIATVARLTFALRSAMEVKRLGTRSSLRKLPMEMTYMVATCLHGVYEDDDEEDRDSWSSEEEEAV